MVFSAFIFDREIYICKNFNTINHAGNELLDECMVVLAPRRIFISTCMKENNQRGNATKDSKEGIWRYLKWIEYIISRILFRYKTINRTASRG